MDTHEGRSNWKQIVCGGPHASNSRSPGGPRERVSQTGGYNLAFMFDLD